MLNEYSKMWLNENQVSILNKVTGDNNINPILATKILNSVRKIVSIIHPNNKYQVIFNGQEDSGYINYKSNKIVLSSALLRETDKYSIYDIIDLEAGLALHESGHAEYSFDSDTVKKLPTLTRLQSVIYNIVEDTIMEEIVSKNYPGFKQYFLKLRGHYFKNNEIKRTNDLLNDRINELLIGLRYPGETIIHDDKVKYCINAINDICNSNELSKVDRVDVTLKIHDLLISDINKDANEQSEQDKQNQDNEVSGNGDSSEQNSGDSQSSEQNNDSKKSNNQYNNIGDRDADDIGGELSDYIARETKDRLTKLTDREKLLLNSCDNEEFNDSQFNENTGRQFNIIHCKYDKCNDVTAYNKYKRPINKYIVKIRNNFADANTIYKETSYGLNSGFLDDDSLYSAKFNRNIFMKNTVYNQKRTKNLDIMFLIDNSGSMNAKTDFHNSETGRSLTRLDIAKQLSTLFIESLEPIKSINTWVYAFQTSYSYLNNKMIQDYNSYCGFDYEQKCQLDKSTQMINLYSPTNKNKHSISKIRPGGLTPECQALTSAINILSEQGRRGSKKVIILLTDGDPGDQRFSLGSQLAIIKEQLNVCKKKDMTVIHLALTDSADKTSMYTNKIKWNKKSYDTLLDEFMKTLKKQI